MSASEKLQALAEKPNRYGGISSDRPTSWDVMDALPQIVAVVEAAEKGMLGKEPKLDAALAALDEALS